MKPTHFNYQQEWKFAWRPTVPITQAEELIISIGSIEDIAEIQDRVK